MDSQTPDIKEKILFTSPAEACHLMGSNMRGLSQEEADKRLEQYGKNELAQKKQTSMLKKFLANFTSLMALLLWAGGVMAILSGALELGIAIFCVNLINGLFSFFQEFKAEKATNALQKMLPAYARVIRDGEEKKILATEIVPGDIMVLEEGDRISADARILQSNDFRADQSTLTGESNPIRKSSDALQQECSYLEAENMVFSGTSAAAGTCRVLVVSTGMDSEFGKIANLTQNTEKSLSPLQKELNVLTKQIALIAFSIGLIFFLIAVFLVKDPWMESFLFALGMIVAFIPEGLLPAVTLSLALAVQKMAKEHALVKKLSSVETLGCTNVICSDKTGTLTKAEPVLADIVVFNDMSQNEILKIAACLEEHFPHSVARAVVRKALEEGLHHEEEHAEVEYIVAHGISSRLHGKKVLVGSYHFLFEDERIPLTEEQRQTIRNHARGKSNIFLAIGRRAIGMIGVSDPPRPEAAETIARLKRQGISSIIMLTGDSESAARAISRQLGITEYRSQVLPEDKARFIQQLKKSGKTVCMVGDGINDSPALSCADVSVSMKDSSDIAREVADISLLSSSLAELVVLRELSCAVLEKIERNYRFIVGFNSSLILLGMFGLITPAFSAFLHNASTVYVSARSTRRCLPLVRGSK